MASVARDSQVAPAGCGPVMSDTTPFLQAILDDTGSDAPRLVFADWLDERGDPHGELIRVQCAIARRRHDDPNRPPLMMRERRLLNRHLVDWFGPLRKLRKVGDPVRGFLPELTVTPIQAL